MWFKKITIPHQPPPFTLVLLRQIKFICPNGFWNILIFKLVLTPSRYVGVAIILIIAPSTGHSHNLYRLKFGYNFLSWNECTDLNFLSNWKYWCEKTTILKCNGELFFDIFYLECIVPLPIKKITFSWCDIASTICKLFSYFHLSLLSLVNFFCLLVYIWVTLNLMSLDALAYDMLYRIHIYFMYTKA